MKKSFEDRMTRMMANYEVLREAFPWDGDLTSHLVALECAMKDQEVDVAAIKKGISLIKERRGILSNFRGSMCYVLSGLCSSDRGDTQEVLASIIDSEEVVKEAGFKSSTYLPIALYALHKVYQKDDAKGYAKKAFGLYKEMKANHPFLTNGDDYALAILLANTNHHGEVLEAYYQRLNELGFSKGNGLQMLSHIMAFSEGDVMTVAGRCELIKAFLEEQGFKVYGDYYPAIGVLGLLEGCLEDIMKDIKEVLEYIKKQKRYKWLGKGMNLFIASALITSEYVDYHDKDALVPTTLSTSIETIIAAQQAAMIAAVSASTIALTST